MNIIERYSRQGERFINIHQTVVSFLLSED
jgi:hypothetical protein